jgi:hypothetical protein
MKYGAFFVLVFFSLSCGNRNQAKVIEFEIYNTQQYCGGAPPSEDIVADLNKPKPSNDTFYLYAGPDRNTEPAILIVKDGKGQVLDLPDGGYMAYRFAPDLVEKMKMSPDPKAGCLMVYYNQFSFSFQVLPETIIVKDTFRINCNPCDEPKP